MADFDHAAQNKFLILCLACNMLFISVCSPVFFFSISLYYICPLESNCFHSSCGYSEYCSCQGSSYCFEWPPKYRCSVMVGFGSAVESKASNNRPEGVRESYDMHTHEG